MKFLNDSLAHISPSHSSPNVLAMQPKEANSHCSNEYSVLSLGQVMTTSSVVLTSLLPASFFRKQAPGNSKPALRA